MGRGHRSGLSLRDSPSGSQGHSGSEGQTGSVGRENSEERPLDASSWRASASNKVGPGPRAGEVWVHTSALPEQGQTRSQRLGVIAGGYPGAHHGGWQLGLDGRVWGHCVSGTTWGAVDWGSIDHCDSEAWQVEVAPSAVSCAFLSLLIEGGACGCTCQLKRVWLAGGEHCEREP